MTKVTIFRVPFENGATAYYAQSGDKQSIGETAGAALDAITAQLQDTGSNTVVILQKMQPDEFFSATQQQRLAQLMDEWRSRRDSGQTLPASTQRELELPVDAELSATVERSNKLLDELAE